MKQPGRGRTLLRAALLLAVPAAIVAAAADTKPPATPDDALIAGFKQTYPASVSDAVELVTGQNGTMRFDMKLVTGKAMVGRAVTSLAKPAPPEGATPALATKHSVEMIDAARPGDVGVIVMEGTLDIAAMGNLMGTGAIARGMAGMVLDGAIRDIWDIRRMGLTVYARSCGTTTTPSSSATMMSPGRTVTPAH